MAVEAETRLPPAAASRLSPFLGALQEAAVGSLVNVTVFGSAARGRYDPATSDLNVVIVLRDVRTAALLRIAQVIHDAERSDRIDAMIVGLEEVPRLARSFPIKLLDIQRTNVVLFGAPVFTGIDVDREDVRSRAEQELRNLALRLRRRLIAARADDQALALAASEASSTLAVNLRALLSLRGVVPAEFQPSLAIFAAAATEFGLDRNVLDEIRRIHKGEASTMSAERFGGLTELVARAADAAARV